MQQIVNIFNISEAATAALLNNRSFPIYNLEVYEEAATAACLVIVPSIYRAWKSQGSYD